MSGQQSFIAGKHH